MCINRFRDYTFTIIVNPHQCQPINTIEGVDLLTAAVYCEATVSVTVADSE